MKSLPTKMRIHLVQMCSKNNKEQNIQELMEHLTTETAINENEMVFLPENSLFMRESQDETVDAFDLQTDELKPLQDFAKSKKVFLHLVIPVKHDGHTYNSSVHILPSGEIEESYRKIHLFDVEVEAEKLIRESDAYKPGANLKTFDYQDVHFGETICYDLRFSNLFLAYADLNVDIILVPSSFFYITGQDHWEVLLRARAIETQAYIIASAQGGYHGKKQRTWGQSMVVDPWGHIIAEIKECSDKPQSIPVTLDLSRIEKVRRQIPLASHRKPSFK